MPFNKSTPNPPYALEEIIKRCIASITMSRDNQNRMCQMPGLGLVCWFLCLALLYVASFGPAHSLAIRGSVDGTLVGSFYWLLPKDVAWHSLQLWRRIDKGAQIEGFWFAPRRPFQHRYDGRDSHLTRFANTAILSLAAVLTAYLFVRIRQRRHGDAAH